MTAERTERCDTRLDTNYAKILEIEAAKVNNLDYKNEMQSVHKILDKLSFNSDFLRNAMIQLENWVEKYQPLKIQKQITETLTCCLESARAKGKLLDYDRDVKKHMRHIILKDIGDPKQLQEMMDLCQRIEDGAHVKRIMKKDDEEEIQAKKVELVYTAEGGLQPKKDVSDSEDEEIDEEALHREEHERINAIEEENLQRKLNAMRDMKEKLLKQSKY